MDYERLYKEALERARKIHNETKFDYEKGMMEEIFPELKLSEDERIRKALYIYLDWLDGRKDYAPKGEYSIRDMIAWLEKQVQKPTDETAPKFHEGEWIIRSAEGFKHNSYLVKEVKDYYVCEDLKGRRVTFTFSDVHKNFKLWDISDARDGDVLVYGDNPEDHHVEIIMLFKK